MSRGEHAADDGSFGRSTTASAGRGVLLIVVALVIGVVLLNATDDPPPGTGLVAGSQSTTTTTTEPDDSAATTTTVPVRPPAEVKVIVANGSDVRGAAGGASEALRPEGYNLLAPTNASSVEASAAYYAEGFRREAAQIAAALELPDTAVQEMPDPRPIPDSKDAHVIIVLGTDHASRFGQGATTTTGPTSTTVAGAAATTTTAR